MIKMKNKTRETLKLSIFVFISLETLINCFGLLTLLGFCWPLMLADWRIRDLSVYCDLDLPVEWPLCRHAMPFDRPPQMLGPKSVLYRKPSPESN